MLRLTPFAITAGALLSLATLPACTGNVSSGSGESGGSGGEGGSGASGGSGGSGAGSTGGSGGTPVVCDTPPSPESFEVGTGEKCFARLSDGDELPLMSGPQGGYHLWLSVGCDDCAHPVHLKYGAHDPATGMPLSGGYDGEAMVPLSSAPWSQAAGIVVNMPGLSWDPENDPPPAKGTPILLWADVLDANDTVLHHGEVQVLIGDIQEWNPCIEDPNNPICQTG